MKLCWYRRLCVKKSGTAEGEPAVSLIEMAGFCVVQVMTGSGGIILEKVGEWRLSAKLGG